MQDAAWERAGTWPAFPDYREAGVDWLGAIPSHWRVRRLKTVASIQTGITLGKRYEPSTRLVDHPYLRVANVQDGFLDLADVAEVAVPEEDVPRYCLRRGDVLLTEGGDFDKLGRGHVWSDEIPGCLHQNHIFAVRPRAAEIEPRFLAAVMGSAYGRAYFTATSVQSTNLASTNSTKLGNFPVPFPPVGEQLSIVAFLDRETAKIDVLIAGNQRLRVLLGEERTAHVSSAVVRGVDADVATRGSGDAWLGSIPAHWTVCPLKRGVVSIRTGTTPPTSEARYYADGQLPWHGPASFGEGLALREPLRLLSRVALEDGVVHEFPAQSTLVVTIGATLGKVAYSEYSGACNQQITAVQFDAKCVFPKYGAYQLKRLEPVLRGIAPSTTLPILGMEQVANLPFVLPPMSEQVGIAEHLDRSLSELERLEGRLREVDRRLHELRTALISAAVTGKIDVRQEVA